MSEADPFSQSREVSSKSDTGKQDESAELTESGDSEGIDFSTPAIEGINFCDPEDVLTPEQLEELRCDLAALKTQRRMDAASAYASDEPIGRDS